LPSHYQSVSELPERICVFPLGGALLLPRSDLPLNVFEPRYRDLVDYTLRVERLIGIIQPVVDDKSDKPKLLKIGCLGRITAFQETPEGGLTIVLTGICRFEVVSEFKVATPFRQLRVKYDNFAGDLVSDQAARSVNRDAVITAFRQYLEANNMSANWDEVNQVPTESLVNALSQMAPYPAPEKQALLEAADVERRAEMLVALTEVALAGGSKRSLQ
jgi:uncharacterized protein